MGLHLAGAALLEARTEAEQVADWGRLTVSKGRTKVGQLRALRDGPPTPIQDAIHIVRGLSEANGITAHVDQCGHEPALDASAADDIASVIREISTNALRHSKGANVWLSITYGTNEFVAVIKDDGCGFDEKALATAPHGGHWGLKGVKERVSGLDGTLTIQTGSPTGTEVTIRIPARSVYRRPPTASHL